MTRRPLVALVVLVGLSAAFSVGQVQAKTTKKKTKRPVATKGASTTRRPSPASVATKTPTIGNCKVFPSDNWWNRDVSLLPLHPKSSVWVKSVGASNLHPDTGSNPDYGIPFVVVKADQPLVPVLYTDYGDESDSGPFPIPADAPVEGGSDRHVLVVQEGKCRLIELFNARKTDAGWEASSGAVFDLNSNDLRPAGWTSADAAGLAILPGLLRYDEVKSGEINHALRFTAPKTQKGFITPARHHAGSVDPNLPPMGARFRLRADVDLSSFKGDALVILKALRRYGMFLADNGSSWYISGATDSRWNDDDLNQLKKVPGSWFEVLDTGPIATK